MIKTREIGGVTIALDQYSGSKGVAFGIMTRCGSRNEREKQMGASHLLEHMLFKWSSKIEPKTVMQLIESVGGYINAETSHDYTYYYAVVPKAFWQKACFVITSIFFFPTFIDNEEVKNEMQVILQEMHMYNDTPSERAVMLFYKHLFQNSSLSHPIIGNEETLNSLVSDQDNHISNFYKLSYRAKDTIISVSGDVDMDEICNYLKELLPMKKHFGESEIYDTKIQYNYSDSYDYFDSKQANIVIGRELNIKYDDPRYYSAVIANQRLGRGGSSKLMQLLREQHALVYSVYSDVTPFIDGGIFTVNLACGVENAKKSVKLVKECIAEYVESYTEKAFDEDKVRYMGILSIRSYADVMHRNKILCLSKLFTGKLIDVDTMLELIKGSSYQNVKELFFTSLLQFEKQTTLAVVGKEMTV
jgi:predicted Zn-dependent peptidase